MKRLHPWPRAVLALYLLGALFLVAAHQHHDSHQSNDCPLCALALTPVVAGLTILQPANENTAEDLLVAPDDRGRPTEFNRTVRSRAPPLA